MLGLRRVMVNLPDGCTKHPCCDTCPFEECKAPKDINKRATIDKRHEEVIKLKKSGLSIQAIMKRTGYKDKSNIYRIFREYGLT